MDNLTEIESQIALLQKQAKEIKAKNFDQTVQDILDKMSAYEIRVKDLELAQRRANKVPGSTTVKPAAIKYRGPNGEAWSGRGLMPRWLTALEAQGKTKDQFAV